MKTPTAYGGIVAVPRLPRWFGNPSNILLEQGVNILLRYLGTAVWPLSKQTDK